MKNTLDQEKGLISKSKKISVKKRNYRNSMRGEERENKKLIVFRLWKHNKYITKTYLDLELRYIKTTELKFLVFVIFFIKQEY